MRLVTFLDPHSSVRVGRLDGDGEDAPGVELAAPSMLDWLRGEGHAPAGRDHALARRPAARAGPRAAERPRLLRLRGPRRDGLRDCAARARSREAWYEAPVFYFSNPASIQGPGDAGHAGPRGCEWLDFELEIAAVIGEDGEIAGFTLLNDWSARDIQRREMTVGLGPGQGQGLRDVDRPVAGHARRAALSRTAACS